MPYASSVRRLLLSAASLALAVAAPAASAVPADGPATNGWGAALSDVPADTNIRMGTLPNGMRYAIMRNATPKGAASVRLRFEFGSFGESEKERGLAHFIEHMAFNGSTNVPEGDMVKILERQGLAFGPDTNAQTGFDSTTYMLDLPATDAQRIDTALMLMRETASEVTFDPAAVDRERGVILGERRSRDNFMLRQVMDQLEFSAPGTPYANRFPIGTEEVLKTASADTLKSLYRRYYRPENATFVFVGDADPVEIEAKIKAKFADWKGQGPAGSPLPFGKVDLGRAATVDTFIDPAVPTRTAYAVLRPWRLDPDSQVKRREELVDDIAMGIFSKRLTRIVNAPGSPFLAAFATEQELRNAALLSSIYVVAKDGEWDDALATTDQELRRALQHGFTKAELDRQMAEVATAIRTRAEQANTRESKAIASEILESVATGEVVSTPAWHNQHFLKIAPTIGLGEVNAAFAKLWTGSQPLVHVSDKKPIDIAAVNSALAESRKLAVAKPGEDAALAFAYDSFGPAGKVVEDKVIADLGIRTIRFANNVRLNIRKTDFEQGKIRYSVRMAGGGLAMPKDKPGLGNAIAMLAAVSATSKHSLEELRTLMAGKNITPGVLVTEDALFASGATTPTDLATQLKVSAAYMIDPGYRPEAKSQWANIVPVVDKQIRSQAATVLQTKIKAALTGDARFGLPDADVLAQRTLDEGRAALAPLLGTAPIEIGIVGDVDETQAIAAVAHSFGALPTRSDAAPAYADARKVAFRKSREPIQLTHDGPADQALVAAYWSTTDDSNYRDKIGFDVVKSVLTLKLTESVREKLGASYGAAVASDMSENFPGFGTFSANAVVAPDNIPQVQAAILDAVAELRAEPINDDLLARARNPLIENQQKSDRENATWIGFVSTAQTKPLKLDNFRGRAATLQSITAADVQRLAQKYLDPKAVQMVYVKASGK